MAHARSGVPRATMADVARAAGVSTATVSRSLRGALVAEETRRRVLEAANDLRALSPESALADLVEAKIERMLAEGEQTVEADDN